ncbi:MAG: histidine phosphatase family protein [Planctomycetota bacterium]|nr:MAG: histidine phosphatase family protein [Planctomycetota bacterium]
MFVRHGATGIQGRFIGRSDPPLRQDAVEQLVPLARRLCSLNPDYVFCSPALRARETRDALLDGLELPGTVLDELSEIDFGEWENKTLDAVKREAGDTANAWFAGDTSFGFPGGESVAAFAERVGRAVAEVLAGRAMRPLICTHGGVIRFAICRLLELPPDRHWCFWVDSPSLTTVHFENGRGCLMELNYRGDR